MIWVMLIELDSGCHFKMKNLQYPWSIGAIIGLLVITGCPDVVEDPDPPARPRLVEKSLPEALVEQGIDADNSATNRIVLMWHPNDEEDLQGYAIYRADTTLDNDFTRIAQIDLLQAFDADTVYFDDSLSNYVDYFYFIRALDISGNKSKPSDTVSYRLIYPPLAISPIDTTFTTSDNVVFTWFMTVPNHDHPRHYVIRLDNVTLNESVWVCRLINNWHVYTNSDPIPFTYIPCSNATSSTIFSCNDLIDQLPVGVYRWKVKAIYKFDYLDRDISSGESEWCFFTIE